MQQQNSTNPYEFAILPDGGGYYQYVIRLAKTRENIAGGLCKSRKKAEQEARQRIANLHRGVVS
jgi:hypothetical protein